MTRRLAEALLGIALLASCGGSPLAAHSPAQQPSALGGTCAGNADCGAGARCGDDKSCHRACRTNTDCESSAYECRGVAPNLFCAQSEANENQEEIDKAIEEGEMYGR